MSQLSIIRANVQANWPDGYFSDYLDNTKTDEYINKTQKWICSGSLFLPDGRHIIHDFSWIKREITASTVNLQRRYALPDGTVSGVWRFRSEITCDLINSDNYRKELMRRFKRDIEHDESYKDTTGKGTPKCYCIDDFDLWLYPLPDHTSNSNTAWTINLEYFGYMPDLSGNTDTNYITDNFSEILEYGAAELGFRYGMDAEKAAYWENKKIEKLLEMLNVDQQAKLTNIEEGIQPTGDCAIGVGKTGYSGVYWDDNIYT